MHNYIVNGFNDFSRSAPSPYPQRAWCESVIGSGCADIDGIAKDNNGHEFRSGLSWVMEWHPSISIVCNWFVCHPCDGSTKAMLLEMICIIMKNKVLVQNLFSMGRCSTVNEADCFQKEPFRLTRRFSLACQYFEFGYANWIDSTNNIFSENGSIDRNFEIKSHFVLNRYLRNILI